MVMYRIYLLLCIKRMLPILYSVGWFHYDGIGKVHLEIITHAAVIDHRTGIIDTPLVTEAVESLLHLERMHKIVIYIRSYDIFRKFIFVF